MNLNSYKHIHCVGIGGIGLSAIAEILLSRGYAVSGSDIKESDVTKHLQALGAQVLIGHDAANLGDTDLLIFSAAVSAENPELAAAKEKGISVMSRAEALGVVMADYALSVAVSGTHGKTTTTSMISLILENAGLSPTILVGGILSELKGNVKVGSSEYFVTEACEYMDSFLNLKPRVEVILNIDSDHLDYFRDIEHIADSFTAFAELVPPEGAVVAFDANPFVKAAVHDLPCKVISYGFNETSDFYAKNIRFNSNGCPAYDLYQNGIFQDTLQLAVPGEHNVANSLAAIATCTELGVPSSFIKETLRTFTGTRRRFDLQGITSAGVTVVDDYAHHPTEIKATLAAAQNVPHQKLWCLFQPHTYTRTRALFNEFAEALSAADAVVLAEIYGAREKNIYQISAASLAEKIKDMHPEKEVFFIPDFEEMAAFVKERTTAGDMVMTMGAGDIYRVGEIILGAEDR
ncbi:MAG: UDP-N-acetylmuramate--L-alanine ligase [Bacillota bacterium]|jgi:UDP-N-acetylmuramate--alanine ligase|nr:UDP-N-acetylmuramate--L-alanine ligase [Bacillota bacterium]NLV70114.1 UDP-N-acetylmuramate--L-alanine ligase [Clostridiales bacterium]